MNRWEIGGVKITRIVELETLSKGTFVLPDATLENVKRDSDLLMPHFADANGKMRMSVHALVLESQGRRIVVDTCIGNDKLRGAPAWNMLHTSFLADLEQARRLYHDDWVSANLVKFFADGGTGLIPSLVYTAHDYEALVMELDSRGYQIMTHALRPDSVHMVLDTYERVEQAHGPRDRRLRIEHAYLVEAADLPRFARLSVIADMQPTFCCGEDGSNIDPTDELPTDRWHTLQQSGAVLAFSSDWPCTWPPSPFVGIQAATTRQVWKSADTAGIAGGSLDGAGQGGAVATGAVYLPDERITVADAVHAYTQGSAFAAFSDARVGTLEAGKLADLAVLSQDIFTVPLETIGKTRVITTMVGGKIVYSAPP